MSAHYTWQNTILCFSTFLENTDALATLALCLRAEPPLLSSGYCPLSWLLCYPAPGLPASLVIYSTAWGLEADGGDLWDL